MPFVPFVLPPPKIKPQSLSNRRVEGRYRVFDVVHDDVADASGRQLRGVYTFTCPDWANIVACTPEGNLVFIWQYRFGTRALELEVPGGVLEPNEDPAVAASRELREETGYESDRIESLGAVAPNPALQGNLCHFFLARDARPTASVKFDEHEDIEVTLVPKAHAAELIESGRVRHALAIIAIERALRRL